MTSEPRVTQARLLSSTHSGTGEESWVVTGLVAILTMVRRLMGH